MAASSLIIRTGVALGTLAGLLAVGEVGLRLLERPFAPAAFQGLDASPAAGDSLARAPLRFDPALFWRRLGEAAPAPHDPNEYLLLVLGDGGALSPAGGPRAWPELLGYLVGLNETSRAVRLVNAAEPGYSSFQGARRFEQLAGLRPDVVCFSFGRNDARQTRIPDLEYARLLGSLGPLSGSWLALHAAHSAWGWRAREAASPRVGVGEYRAHAAGFLERARALGATPILIASGTPAYDAALEGVGFSAGAAVLPRGDDVRLAESVLDVLAEHTIVLTQRRRAAGITLDGSHDGGPELEAGWLPAETTSGGARGRRVSRQASLALETLAGERGAVLDVTCPEGFSGRVEVDGGTRHDLSDCRGREWRRIPLGTSGGGRIRMRFFDEGPSDAGLIVHGVRLAPSDVDARVAGEPPLAAQLDLAEAAAERPELGPGFWPRETWSDGRQGRWTAREASFWLARRDAERALILDVSLQRPDDVTRCRVEANGIPVYEFRTRNGRHRFGIDVQRVPGRVVHVRLVVDRTFLPGRGDPRALGLFIHSARLAASEVP